MAVAAPPKPPSEQEPQAPDPLEALIKEARRRARRRRAAYAACALVAAAIAVSAYGFGRDGGGGAAPGHASPSPAVSGSQPLRPARANGRLAIVGGQGISIIGSRGRLVPLFRCRASRGCYDIESIAWSPDGRRLAFTVTSVGAGSGYNGLHVYDAASGRERKISFRDGFSLAWSPDGSRIAYVESNWFPAPWGTIYLINADGSKRHEIQTGTSGGDMSPSWSPDGRRLVFATTPDLPDGEVDEFPRRSWISSIDLDGSDRKLLAPNASAPAWSPNGATIAYHARCGGIKLITPAGVDVTPAPVVLRCRSFGPRRGAPVWSPDGRKIAIANKLGLFVVNLRSRPVDVRLTTGFGSHDTGLGIFRTARPSWRPIPKPKR